MIYLIHTLLLHSPPWGAKYTVLTLKFVYDLNTILNLCQRPPTLSLSALNVFRSISTVEILSTSLLYLKI